MKPRISIRKYANTPIREIGENGETIKIYADPYEVAESIRKTGKYAEARNIIDAAKAGKKFRGHTFKFHFVGDFELTSNNLPDVE